MLVEVKMFVLMAVVNFSDGFNVFIPRNSTLVTRDIICKLISQIDYDLILLDVLMPEINGLEVLMETRKKIRSR